MKTEKVKLKLVTWIADCEDCGGYEGYEFYVNDEEICSYEGHFGNGKGPYSDNPEASVAFVKRTLDTIGIHWEYEVDES